MNSESIAPFTSVGIIGRGIIGASWAMVFARVGLRVRIWCRQPEKLAEAHDHISDSIRALDGTGLEGDAGTLERISLHTSLADALAGVDYVQESVAESEDLKREMLALIEQHAPRHAIIGSSTSGIMPSRLASALTSPERFLVVHPLTPPHLLPVTEICATPHTDEAVVSHVRTWLTELGQHPITIQSEVPGFALNRVLGAMMNECFALIRDGVLDPQDVDPLLTEGFGLRWGTIGPLAAMELNAPGGIGEYLSRYGSIYETVARSRGAAPVLTDALIAQVDEAVGSPETRRDPAKRAQERDRRIAELRTARDRIMRDASH